MEEMLGEVEQMERVNLLQNREVKELLKKRKHFEYKIQKRTKVKEDFISYIQYEVNLLSLLEIRRENTGYHHKKAEIEGAIKTRINKLYKILEHRFQSDVNVWLSHINYLKSIKWDSSVSRIYLRLLQVHSEKPNLWIAAAKWEFEEVGNADNGRQILLRGLRFLPKSWLLHHEYIKLELMYVEQLKKRSEVLGVDGGGNEVSDNVMDCAIVKLVVKAAIEALDSAEFIVSLMPTMKLFSFASELSIELMNTLKEKYPKSPVTWDTLAREKIQKSSRCIKDCMEKYYEGLEVCQNKDMFGFAFTTLNELPEIFPNSMVRIMKQMKQLLEYGYKNDLLGVDQIKFWLHILDVEENTQEMKDILTHSLTIYAKSVELWIEYLVLIFKSEGFKAALKCFSSGLKELDNKNREICRLWKVFLSMLTPEKGWEILNKEEGLLNKQIPELRILHLEQAAYRGISTAREIYESYKNLPPFNRDFHYTMLDFEKEEAKSISNQRQILSTICDQFGTKDVNCWLDAANLEIRNGNPLEGAKILARGEGFIEEDLQPKYAVIRNQMAV